LHGGRRAHYFVGPMSAAQLLVSWSHPGRFRSEAAFAALGGVSPLPASSGRVVRHRLNRSGDRQLNRALHTITTWRMLHGHQPTSAYLARRRAEQKSDAEIRRCLKRYAGRSPAPALRLGTLLRREVPSPIGMLPGLFSH
jgi:transposase